MKFPLVVLKTYPAPVLYVKIIKPILEKKTPTICPIWIRKNF